MTNNGKDKDELTVALEEAVLAILRSPKSKPGEKLAAIANGVRLLATRHAVAGSGDPPDFFGGAGS
jgi:hypothetical protein